MPALAQEHRRAREHREASEPHTRAAVGQRPSQRIRLGNGEGRHRGGRPRLVKAPAGGCTVSSSGAVLHFDASLLGVAQGAPVHASTLSFEEVRALGPQRATCNVEGCNGLRVGGAHVLTYACVCTHGPRTRALVHARSCVFGLSPTHTVAGCVRVVGLRPL